MADPAAYLISSPAPPSPSSTPSTGSVLRRETFFALNRALPSGAAVLSLGLPLLRVPSPFVRTVVYSPALPVSMDTAAAAAPSQSIGLSRASCPSSISPAPGCSSSSSSSAWGAWRSWSAAAAASATMA
ncbi:MAG: hypothetical protein MZU84_01950 [Sphingobacterium sp.]|nr:hypothetical protein [Sphingobacterium sp.]